MPGTRLQGREKAIAVVAAAVVVGRPGPGQAENGARGQALEVAGERRIRSHHDHAGAPGLAGCPPALRDPGPERVAPEGAAHRHPVHGEDAAEVGLDEHAQVWPP